MDTNRRGSLRGGADTGNAPLPAGSCAAVGPRRALPTTRARKGSPCGDFSLSLREVIPLVGGETLVRLAVAVRPDDGDVRLRVAAQSEVLLLRGRGEVADGAEDLAPETLQVGRVDAGLRTDGIARHSLGGISGQTDLDPVVLSAGVVAIDHGRHVEVVDDHVEITVTVHVELHGAAGVAERIGAPPF